MSVLFQSLKLENWKQFGRVDLTFHSNLTILTGANGSGKTTILNILAKHFGWQSVEAATPQKGYGGGIIKYFLSWLGSGANRQNIHIGSITYDARGWASLIIPREGDIEYQISIERQQEVFGISIPSHRQIYRYVAVDNIHTRKREPREAAEITMSHHRNPYYGGSGPPPNYSLKETLLAWAIFGGGNNHIEPDPQQESYFRGFELKLRAVLPPHLGFESIAIRQNSVVFVTKDEKQDFVIDSASGGIAALIDLTWQIYLMSISSDNRVTVVIDEVENHLHASMQRRLLPSLVEAFPNTQFIISTHSPLIIGSVKDSIVYVLKYNESSRIDSVRLDLKDKAQAADDILREVLGVPFSMPLWVEDQLKTSLSKYRSGELTSHSINLLKEELRGAGLGHLIGEALNQLSESDR